MKIFDCLNIMASLFLTCVVLISFSAASLAEEPNKVAEILFRKGDPEDIFARVGGPGYFGPPDFHSPVPVGNTLDMLFRLRYSITKISTYDFGIFELNVHDQNGHSLPASCIEFVGIVECGCRLVIRQDEVRSAVELHISMKVNVFGTKLRLLADFFRANPAENWNLKERPDYGEVLQR